MDVSSANPDGGSSLTNAAKREVKRKVLAWLLSNPAVWFIILCVCATILLMAFVFIAGGVQAQQQCGVTITASGGAPTREAKNSIPADWMPVLKAAEQQFGVPWNIDAGIAKVETDFGRSNLPGVHSGANSAGASGPMQIGTGGAAGDTWGKYGVDGDGDGKKDVYDVADAVFGAANYLKANGAPADLHRAILAYNHAEWYYQEVMQYATSYAKGDFTIGGASASNVSCQTDAGIAGSFGGPAKKVTYDGRSNWLANLPGTSLQCDYRIIADVEAIMKAGFTITACYAATGHEAGGEHPLGLAVDAVPTDGNWDEALNLAHEFGWKELCETTGCASQMPPPMRFVGYNGYPGHGDPAHAGNNAHIHLSWMHEPTAPGSPAAWVYVF